MFRHADVVCLCLMYIVWLFIVSKALLIHVQWAARTLPSGSAMIQESSGFSHILLVWSTANTEKERR